MKQHPAASPSCFGSVFTGSDSGEKQLFHCKHFERVESCFANMFMVVPAQIVLLIYTPPVRPCPGFFRKTHKPVQQRLDRK